jgi:hypothetical protein
MGATKGKISPWPEPGALHTCPVREDHKHDGKIVGWRWVHIKAHTEDFKSEVFPSQRFAQGAAEAIFEIAGWEPIPFTKDGRTAAIPKEHEHA